jgi:hypothetical protein
VVTETYNIDKTVTVRCETAGATIHYTTNGVDSTESDPVIASGTVLVTARSLRPRIKAVLQAAASSGHLHAHAGHPTLTPPGGVYAIAQTVAIRRALLAR